MKLDDPKILHSTARAAKLLRGVRKPGTIMTTSAVLGLFRTRDRTRAEFFAHLERRPPEDHDMAGEDGAELEREDVE